MLNDLERTDWLVELLARLDVVERDLRFYDPVITEEFVAGMNKFAGELNLLSGPVGYEDVVATQFSDLWTA